MIVLAILTNSPLQRTSTPGQGLLCELGVVASYFDDDAVVSVIGLGLIFNGIAGPWYNISIFCYLLVGSQMWQCTEVDVPKLSIFWPVCVYTEVVWPYVPKRLCTDLALPRVYTLMLLIHNALYVGGVNMCNWTEQCFSVQYLCAQFYFKIITASRPPTLQCPVSK